MVHTKMLGKQRGEFTAWIANKSCCRRDLILHLDVTPKSSQRQGLTYKLCATRNSKVRQHRRTRPYPQEIALGTGENDEMNGVIQKHIAKVVQSNHRFHCFDPLCSHLCFQCIDTHLFTSALHVSFGWFSFLGKVGCARFFCANEQATSKKCYCVLLFCCS